MKTKRLRMGILLVMIGVITLAVITAAGTQVAPPNYPLIADPYPHTCTNYSALCQTSSPARVRTGTPIGAEMTPVAVPLPTAPSPILIAHP